MLVITVKNLIQYIEAFFQQAVFPGISPISGSLAPRSFADYTCTDTVSFHHPVYGHLLPSEGSKISEMSSACGFGSCRYPRHIFIPDLLIRSARYINRLMGFSFPMRRYIRPFISVMPDQDNRLILWGTITFSPSKSIYFTGNIISLSKRNGQPPQRMA